MYALRTLAGGFPALCQPAWSQSLGIEAPKADVAESRDKGHALVATEKVRKNEVIVRVPFRALLEAPDNQNSTLAEKLLKSRMHEPYREVLPEKFHLPQSVETLDGTALAGAQVHAREVNQIRPMGIPVARWQWALDAISTRSGFFGTDECLCLCPLICFANHASRAEDLNAYVLRSADSVDLIATRDIEAREEVSISYGDLSTEQLLWTYGFFEGKFSIVCPFVELGDDDRVAMLQRLICLDSGAIGPRLEDGSIELKVWIALTHCSPHDLRRIVEDLHASRERGAVKTVVASFKDVLPGDILRRPEVRKAYAGILQTWKGALEKLQARQFPGAIGTYIEESLQLVSRELKRIP